MRLFPLFTLFLAPLLLALPVHAIEPQQISMEVAREIITLRRIGDAAFITTIDRKSHQVALSGGSLTLTPAALPLPLTATDPDRLPDTNVEVGTRNIRQAWFARPTRRYDHGVLGDAIEAASLKALMSDDQILEVRLPETSVFEDRTPRLADIDGDGQDEIIAVRSYLNSGAAVTLIGQVGANLQIIAEAPSIGQPNRWLNPVGAADFDGDGTTEIAVVITPHIGGTLQLYEWQGDRLVKDLSARGFSNHAMGSRELGLSALADVNNDGIVDMVLPDAGRASLVAVTFAQGMFRALSRTPLDGLLTSRLVAADLDGDESPEVLYVTRHNRLTALTWTQ